MCYRLEELKKALRPTLASLNAYRQNRLPPLLPFGQITKQNMTQMRPPDPNPPAADPAASAQIPGRIPKFPPLVGRPFDAGNEADIESSNCSSLASSRMNCSMGRPRWKQSIHSIGYDNEYELASVGTSQNSSMASGMHFNGVLPSADGGGRGGGGSDFVPMDADINDGEMMLDARGQVELLSRDIRRNFGEFQLATFSDIDKSE